MMAHLLSVRNNNGQAHVACTTFLIKRVWQRSVFFSLQRFSHFVLFERESSEGAMGNTIFTFSDQQLEDYQVC